MAKPKEQKRDEALRRNAQRLIARVIPDWVNHFRSPQRDQKLDGWYENTLISAAHATHCDRHGNFLDARFYKELHTHAHDPHPFECAKKGKLYSLEELKNLYAYGEVTLYQIAYGR